MPAENPIDPDGERVPEALAEAGVYSTKGDGFDHGLVVLAMGSPYWLMPFESRYRLMVEPGVAAEAREQLLKFYRESAHWPPDPEPRHPRAERADLASPLAWALAVVATYWAQGRWPGRLEELGALDGRVFSRAEVWRPATALFLHADSGHVISNLFAGYFVFSAVVTTSGRRRGWLALAGASVAGNLLAAGLRATEAYESIGASTAVFAVLGILTGRAIRSMARAPAPRRMRGIFTPLAAGLVTLALYGAGGVEVDALAHLTGFSAGVAAGFMAGRATDPVRDSAPAPSSPSG